MIIFDGRGPRRRRRLAASSGSRAPVDSTRAESPTNEERDLTETSPDSASFELPDPTRERPGCSRGLWLGCGLLLVLFAFGGVLLVVKAPDFLDWIMRQTEEQIVANLPPDVSEEERQRLTEEMARCRQAIESGQVDPLAVRELQGELVAVSRKLPDRLTREDVLRLIETLEAFNAAARDRKTSDALHSHGSLRARITVQA